MPIGVHQQPARRRDALAAWATPSSKGTLTLDSVYDTTKNSIAINALTVDAPKVGKLAFAAKFSDTSLGGIAGPRRDDGRPGGCPPG